MDEKLALRRSLERLQTGEAALRSAGLTDLIGRAQDQPERLEQQRLRAVANALQP